MRNYALRGRAAHSAAEVLFRMLARAELAAPTAVHSAFIAPGKPYDVFVALKRVFGNAKSDVLVIDPYLDEKVLEFATTIPESVTIRLLADEKKRKPSLVPAVVRWKQEHGAVRPVEVRLASEGVLHDRLIVLDRNKLFELSQSLNAFATRSPASIHETDKELAPLKVAAYQNIWSAAVPIP